MSRFSQAHDTESVAEPLWRDLIPLTAPQAGEQYAFEVDLDRCTGCKACVAGCHSLNGLDHEETWRDTGLILGGTRSHPFQQTVTSACHHCEDPGCLSGCPVLAYEKDPLTGIVRHLDDQCIGCQYCVLKCPYDVPKYSERLGIVRKCDMCHGRLSAGEAPACVQSCPTQAIRIVTVSTGVSPVGETFPPVEVDHEYTRPTTRYVTARKFPDRIVAADATALRPQPPHWPLVVMLTLIPMAVGCFALQAVQDLPSSRLTLVGWAAAALGLSASALHLGQPLRAWRVFLGLRTSWLSREAVIFGGWFAGLSLYTAGTFFPTLMGPGASVLAAALTPLAAMGMLGLFCSAMIYIDTRRVHWRSAQTLPRFFGAGFVLALSAAQLAEPSHSFDVALAIVLACKLGVELRCLRVLDLDSDEPTPERQTAELLNGPLRNAHVFRIYTGVFAMIGATVALVQPLPLAARLVLFALAFSGELTERYLYFRAVYAPKMPGYATL